MEKGSKGSVSPVPLLEQVWGHVQGEGHSWVMAVNKNCCKGWGRWENTTVGLREQGQVTCGYQGLYKPFISAALPALLVDKEQQGFTTRLYPKKTLSTPKGVKLCFVGNSLRAH